MFFSPPQALRYKVQKLALGALEITRWEIELQLNAFEFSFAEVEISFAEIEISFVAMKFSF